MVIDVFTLKFYLLIILRLTVLDHHSITQHLLFIYHGINGIIILRLLKYFLIYIVILRLFVYKKLSSNIVSPIKLFGN